MGKIAGKVYIETYIEIDGQDDYGVRLGYGSVDKKTASEACCLFMLYLLHASGLP